MLASRTPGAVAALVLLAGCGGAPAGGGTAADPGARVYAMHCLACHQRDGRGLGGTQPALAGSATANGDPQALVAWVLFGDRPATLAPTRSVVVMPQFSWLSDEDVAAVLTHVRGHFGNASPAISAAEVAAIRAARDRR